MKKSIPLFLYLFLILFSACSGSVSGDSASEATTPATTTVSETTLPPTEAPPETTEPPLQAYPLNVGTAYCDFAVDPPDHLYNTLGSENGLAGTIYSFEGTVTAIEEMTAGGFIYPIMKIDTDRGEVMIMDMFTAVYSASLKQLGEIATKAVYNDNPAFYQFPAVGEEARFITVYMGYSQAEDLPVFIYGASPDIFMIGEYTDPVVSALTDTPAE